MFQRIDNALISVIERVFKLIIKLFKYKYHKLNISAAMSWAKTFSLGFLIGGAVIDKSILSVLITIPIIILGLSAQLRMIVMHADIKEAYEFLFHQRKNELVYRALKKLADHFKKAPEWRDRRKFILELSSLEIFFAGVQLVFFDYLGMYWHLAWAIYFFFSAIEGVIFRYTLAAFTIEPPDDSDKKESDELTDFEKSRWSRIINSPALNPAPAL